MVTGIETAGLVLAILPLILKQLDLYIQGIETVTTLRKAKYRRFLDHHAALLDGQRSKLIHTMEMALEGIVPQDQISPLETNPHHPLWQRESVQQKLRDRLGRDYTAFCSNLEQAGHILQELAERLEVNLPVSSSYLQPSVTMHQIRKIKTILSKSVYVELFRKMDGHNGMLRELIEQSLYRNATRQNSGSDAIHTVQQYKLIRKVVSSIYKTVIQERFWRCPCRDVHTIRFVLDQKVNGCDEVEKVRFRMIFTAPASGSMIATISKWHEVAVEPAQIQSVQQTSPSAPQQGLSQPMVSTESSFCMDPSHQISPSQISDMCNALARYVTSPDNQKPLGYLSDGPYRHDLFVLKSDEGRLDSQSLEELLRESSQFLPSVDGGFDFSRRDRLYLAAKLASTVIQFQGNWLPESWGSGDISISKNAASLAEAIRHPFLTRKLVNSGTVEKSLRSSQVCNETFFQLGLALIELSLCRPMSLLQNPQESASDKIAGLLLTANRCLETVYGQSGMRYCNVVSQCLIWARTRHMEVESDEFQAAVLESVVKPLVRDLACFDSPA